MAKTSEIRRVHKELCNEIDRLAKLNDENQVQASREIAKFMKANRNKKMSREIRF